MRGVWVCGSVGLLLAVAVCVSCVAVPARGASSNNRPIVGVLAQPSSSSLQKYGGEYIAASYVKFLEAGGARVVPISYKLSEAELTALLSSINGVLFPGGGSELEGQFWETAQRIWQFVLTANKKGDYFPLWGTCMGFEMIMSLGASSNTSVLTHFDSENYTVPLDLTAAAADSSLFQSFPTDVVHILSSQPVTMNNHMLGVSPSTFYSNMYLPKLFNVLSTNKDRQGLEFISTVEAAGDLPIFAVQWHPEKNQYEWNPDEVIQHTADAVMSMQYVTQFIVDQARQNTHAFASKSEETKALIYNYSPVFTESFDPSFEQCYIFP